MQSQFSQFWTSLEPRQKIALAAVALFTIVGLSAVAFWASRPDFQVLYTGLAPEDAGRVIECLRKKNIPYRVRGGGAVIEAPSERVYEARLDLAVQGLPSGGSVGFEIFDRSTLPGTEFTNTINYQRALQGELARTIAQLHPVAAARVHITLPQPSLYASKDSPPTASVVVQLKPGARLTAEEVQGIAHLVASAVENLEPENVTVVDASGKTLAPGRAERDSAGALTTSQLAVVEAFERSLQTHIQRMLDAVLGESKSAVSVRAELNFDTQETLRERYEPTGADKGYIRREQTAQQDYQGAGYGPSGAPGMDSNVLGSGPPSVERGSGGKFSSSDKTVEYQFSKTVETIKKAPGQVKRLSVAATVDESVSAAQVSAIRGLIEAAAGIDIERGDTLRVESMKMASAQSSKEDLDAEKKALAAERRWRLILAIARYVAIALVGLLIFKAGDTMLGRIQAMSAPGSAAESAAAGALPEPALGGLEAAPAPMNREQPELLPFEFHADPVAVAAQLSQWLGGAQPGDEATSPPREVTAPLE
jgi:flagellar M-ring protein FliF